MEIIERKDVSKVHTCEYCKSIIKYEPADIKTLYPSMVAIELYGGAAFPMDYIVCPVCNKTNFIKDE